MAVPLPMARAIARRLLDDDDRALVELVRLKDAGHGFDPFGLHRDYVAMGLGVSKFLYEKYFRVQSYGTEHVPTDGPAILTPNHSGTLPADGMMLWSDVVQKVHRVPRAVADHFVPTLPFVGTFFSRSGVVGGSRGNVRALLDAGELLMIFPEGTMGISKSFEERYQLQAWRVGHAELAIRHRAPVVPVAFIGPEEQMPQVARIPIKAVGRMIGLPFVPVPATPVPLPVRYHIHYGEPIAFDRDYKPGDADDPAAVREAAAKVEAAVRALIAKGLKQRGGRLFT